MFLSVSDLTLMGRQPELVYAIVCRLFIAALCAAVLFLSLLRHFSAWMSPIGVLVYGLTGIAIPLASTKLKGRPLEQMSTVMMMLFFGLVGNVSGLMYRNVVVTNCAVLLAWVAIYFLPDFLTPEHCALECEDG